MPTEVAVPVGTAVAGQVLGGTKEGRVDLPNDLRPTRRRQIDLLNWLTGFDPGSDAWAGQGGGQPTRGQAPGGIYSGGKGTASFAGGGGGGFAPPEYDEILKRITGYFGDLGVPTTGLQRQATDAISHFLSQPAPEQRTLDIALPALQDILQGKPGQGVIDALQPSFERNLASANQQGARFGSANAVLRGRAVEDFNLLGAQAAQQGQQTQLAAADALRLLGESAGNNPFQRAAAGYGIGQQEASQQDIATQRFLQILLQQLGTAQTATLGAGTQAPSNGFGNFLGGVNATAATWEQLSQLLGGGASGKANIPGGTGGGSNG